MSNDYVEVFGEEAIAMLRDIVDGGNNISEYLNMREYCYNKSVSLLKRIDEFVEMNK